MSQLIYRLRRNLVRATQMSEQIEAGAKLALQLARVGAFDEARQQVGQARSLFIDGRGGVDTIWVMLAEALIYFFEQQSPQARIRISAAQVLALAISHSPLIAATSAWKAHILFENSDFAEMVESLRLAFDHAIETDLDARTRSAIVLFNAFSTSGEIDKAQSWFSRAHAYAIKNGDQASVDALLYNKTVLILGHLRVKQSAGIVDAAEIKRVRREFMSSQNLNSLTGISALANHFPFVNSQLLMLEGNFSEAAEMLRAVRYESPFSSKNFSQSYVDLELCFCKYKLKEFSAVEDYLRLAQVQEFEDLDIDENIVSIWMRLQMAENYPLFGLVDELQSRLSDLCLAYFASRKVLVGCVEAFS